MNFVYSFIRYYPGKTSKLIHKHQDSDKTLLCQFVKVEVFKGTDMDPMPPWAVKYFPFFNSCQDSLNSADRRGLVQNKKNLVNSILDHF